MIFHDPIIYLKSMDKSIVKGRITKTLLTKNFVVIGSHINDVEVNKVKVVRCVNQGFAVELVKKKISKGYVIVKMH